MIVLQFSISVSAKSLHQVLGVSEIHSVVGCVRTVHFNVLYVQVNAEIVC